MNNYKTVMEISTQWNVTAKTVQNLCKNGKIEGAVKRAGVWFIPIDAPNPLRNTKAGTKNFNFVGTKKKIFDNAINLFMLKGYENVSIKDITDSVGIMQSAIYNHFSSKQKILDTIYSYYVKNFYMNKIPVERMKEILREKSREEFCNALMFTFESEDVEKQTRMFFITKIIYMRFFQDKKANDIFLDLMNAQVEEYVKEVLEYGVSVGILEEFDIDTCAKFFVGQRHIMGMKAFASPDYKPEVLEEERRIMAMSADMIPYAVK